MCIRDSSGIWQTDVKYNFNLGADLKPDDIVMLPWAQALQAERRDNNGKDDPEGLCLPPGFPRVNGVPFPQKIVQLPGAIIILYETRTTFRQIFFDNGHTLPSDPQPTWMGYSKGRWDGDTLIVDTAALLPGTLFNNGVEYTENVHLLERFRLADANTLIVTQQFEDAGSFEGSAARIMSFRRGNDHVYPYDCDPTYGLDIESRQGPGRE